MSGRRRRLVVTAVGGALVLAAAGAIVASAPGDEPAPEAGPTAAAADPASPSEAAPAAPSPTPSPTTTGGVLVMWARGGLPATTAADAARLPGVEAVAFVRSDTLGVVGVRDADGEPVQSFEPGWRAPVEVTAVDPAAWLAVVDGSDAGPRGVGALEPGTVVLSESGAVLRAVDVGGRIDLAGLADLRVVAVVPDGQLRRAEMMLHPDDAAAAGVGDDGSLVIRHTLPDGAGRDDLVAELEALVPADAPARIVTGDLAGYRAPLVLTLPEVKRRFGEFAYRPRGGEREIDIAEGFVDERILHVEVPILGAVTCHRGIVDDLRSALEEIVAAGLADAIDPDGYAGCFYPRRISVDRDRLSRHSWGIALDINVDLSLPGLGPPPPPEVVDIFGRHGFRWGGDFLHPDNHHFEWVGAAAAERPARTP